MVAKVPLAGLSFDTISETKTESYVVRVPKKVTKQVCVKVKKCIEEEVSADDACGCSNGNDSGNGGRGHGWQE